MIGTELRAKIIYNTMRIIGEYHPTSVYEIGMSQDKNTKKSKFFNTLMINILKRLQPTDTAYNFY
jgi:hypothetical protein